MQLQSLESLGLGEKGEGLCFNEGVVRRLRSRGGLLVEQIVQNVREGFERVVFDFDALGELAAFQRLQFEHVATDKDLNVAERLIERLRRIGTEVEIVRRPIIDFRRRPRRTVVGGGDPEVGEIVGAVADGRHLELTQIGERRLNAARRPLHRGTETDGTSLVDARSFILRARSHDERHGHDKN